MKRILVLGGGFTAGKRLHSGNLGFYVSDEDEVVDTIDINEGSNPTWVHDLNVRPWPCNERNATRAGYRPEYDEVHAYEILEHLGQQGDVKSFFDTFNNIHNALKKDGLLFASCPSWKSIWAWGDPGHTRIFSPATLVFLCRSEYEKQVGRTAMSDYREYLLGNWEIVNFNDDGESFRFVMRAK